MSSCKSHRLSTLGPLLGLAIAAACLLASSARATGDSGRALGIDVSSQTPLAVAARVLERRHGAAITYEDPVYAGDSDLVPSTTRMMAESGFGQPRVVRLAHLGFSYPVSGVRGQPEDLAAVVQQAIDLHASAGNPGRFRLEREGEVLHIVPAQVRGASGQWEAVTPVLDTQLNLGGAERNLEDTLALILQSVNRATKAHIASLQEPINVERRIQWKPGAGAESARTLITRLVGQLPGKSSWSLKYEPRNGMMAFEIHEVASRR